MSAASRLAICALCVVLALGARRGNGRPGRGANNNDPQLPQIESLPAKLPTSSLKEDGKSIPVDAMARGLKAAVTRPCRSCQGTGKIKQSGSGQGFTKPVFVACGKCGGDGQLAGDKNRIADATTRLVKAIVCMAPDAKNSSTALNNAYEGITNYILKNQDNYKTLQEQSAAVLAKTKPDVDQMILTKGLFANEVPDPDRPDSKVYIVRVAHKKQVLAIVSPKQADPPQDGGRALVAGVIAGKIELDTGSGKKESVIIVERGFIISPNLDEGWWNAE